MTACLSAPALPVGARRDARSHATGQAEGLARSEPPKPQPFVEADDLATVQEQILALKLDGREAIESLLYIIVPNEENRLLRPIVGATGDFSKQLVRRMNRASKGRMNLQLLPEPPVITDFERRDGRGVLHPWVRVVVGAVGRATGETKFAVKEQPRRNRHAVTIALETAEHKALESHPSYDRKLVCRHLKELLRKEGLNPDHFIIAGAQGSNEWARYFVRAKEAGVDGDALRQAVRDKTGSGLSEKTTAQQVAQAVQVLDETIDAAATPVAGSEELVAPRTTPFQDAPTSGPVADSSEPTADGQVDELDRLLAEHRTKAEEIITQLRLAPQSVESLKRKIGVTGDWQNWPRLRTLLEYIATGQPADVGVAAAFEKYPKAAPLLEAAPAGAQR